MVTVLLAPDSFKGTLSAREVADHLARGITTALPGADVVALPVADGGEGTVDAALAAGYEAMSARAHGPTGEALTARWARRGDVAVVELAEVSGLARLPGGRLDAMRAGTGGTGEVMRAALDAGCRTLVLAVGGSASTDGGAGLLTALGARVTDAAGADVAAGGGALAGAAALDLSGLDPRLEGCDVVVACDVDNPLTGTDGAAAVYGPQKGATPVDVVALDAALTRWAGLVAGAVGPVTTGLTSAGSSSAGACTAGSGAAGGVGFAALAVLGARLRPGIDLVLELTGFAPALTGADLVVTGEGCLDAQTLRGKAPAGVAAAAAAAGTPVVAVCGRLDLDDRALRGAGIRAAYPLTDVSGDLDECLTRPGPLLEQVGARIAADLPRLRAAVTRSPT